MKKRLISITIILSMIFTLVLSGCGLSDLLDETYGITVFVVDESENPIEGASVQLCTDKSCYMAETDFEGKAFFEQMPGKYSVHILSVPNGYLADPDDEYITSSDSTNFQITIATASEDKPATEEKEEQTEELSVNDEESHEPETSETAEASDSEDSAVARLSKYKLDNYVPKKSSNKLKFTTTDLDGNTVDSSIFAENKVTVVNFFASWCGPCKEELPYFVSINEEFRENGIGFLGIATMRNDTVGDLKEVIADYNVSYPVIKMNGELSPFHGDGIPQTLFVDSEGNILDITMEEAVAAMEILDMEQAERYKAGEFESAIESEDERAMFDYYYLYGGWQELLEEEASTSIYKGSWTCSLPEEALLTFLADRYF